MKCKWCDKPAMEYESLCEFHWHLREEKRDGDREPRWEPARRDEGES